MRRVAVLIVAVCSFLQSSEAMGDEYTVTIDQKDVRIAHVVASVHPVGNVVAMNDENNQGLERGWSTFVEALTIVDRDGNNLTFDYKPTSRWEIAGYTNGPITLSYDVRLGHDKAGLNFGDNGAAYANDSGVMWSGRALFIAGKPSRDVTLRFELPSAWQATTPWAEKAGAARTFVPRSSDDLLNSAFFAGTHTTFQLSVGEASFRFALAGKNVNGMRERFKELTEKYMRCYDGMLGPAQSAEMLLIASDSTYWGGEVMGRVISLSVASHGRGGHDPLSILSHVIAHEIFHLWNTGIAISDEHLSDFEWFNEGFSAEYFPYMASLHLGDLTDEAFVAVLEEHWNTYAAARSESLSLASSGRDKTSNHDMVYSGGMIAAAALDFGIRHQTGGKQTLATLLRTLLMRYPRSRRDTDAVREESLTLDKLFDVARALYGEETSSAFQRYVQSGDVIPFAQFASLAGLKIVPHRNGKTIKLTRLPNPDAAQRAVWNSISRAQ